MWLAFLDILRDAMALDPLDFITGYEFVEEALKLLQVDLFVATSSNIPAESFEVYEVALALVDLSV